VITVTNNSLTNGASTVSISAKTSDGQEVTESSVVWVEFCAPDYGYSVRITNITSSLDYNKPGSVTFEVTETHGMDIPIDGSLGWIIEDVGEQGILTPTPSSITTRDPITASFINRNTQ